MTDIEHEVVVRGFGNATITIRIAKTLKLRMWLGLKIVKLGLYIFGVTMDEDDTCLTP